MKRLIVLVFLFSSSFIIGPQEKQKLPKRMLFDKEKAIHILKTKPLYMKDLKEIHSIAFPLIYYSINDSLINRCKLNKVEIAIIIETIAIFEGSTLTKRGAMPFKSQLFINSNNAFGIKGKGHIIRTTEYFNGKRTRIVSSFKYYNGFGDAINDLLNLLIRRYKLCEITKPNYAFINMKKFGYFTAPNSYMWALISMNRRLNKLNRNSQININ